MNVYDHKMVASYKLYLVYGKGGGIAELEKSLRLITKVIIVSCLFDAYCG